MNSKCLGHAAIVLNFIQSFFLQCIFLKKLLTWLIKNIGVSVAFGKSLDNLREIGKVISEEEFSVMSCGFDELNCDTSARVSCLF